MLHHKRRYRTIYIMENVLTVEQEYDAPIDLVWRAITEVELLQKWYFNIDEFKLEVGFKFQFEGGEEDKRYIHLCEILEIIPLQKLPYSWRYQGYPRLSFVTFNLDSNRNKTKVTVTHEGIETFTNPDFKRENFNGGWNYLLHESLKAFLDQGDALRYW